MRNQEENGGSFVALMRFVRVGGSNFDGAKEQQKMERQVI